MLGYSISAACLIWVLHGYPLDQLGPTLRALDYRWVGLAVVADLAVYVAHGWRWNTLLAPVARLRFWRTVQAIYIGLFANEVLPLRTGEVIRCYLLAHWNDLRLSLTFASAGVERIIDGIWMLVAFFVTASFVRGIPRDLTLLVQVLAVLLLIGTGILLWIVMHKQHAHAVLSESRWSATLRHIVEGLHLMGNPHTLGLTAVISLVYFALQILSVFALMRAYGLDLSFWAARWRAHPGPPQHGGAERAGQSRPDQSRVRDGARPLRSGKDRCQDVLHHPVRRSDITALGGRRPRHRAHRA